MSNAIIQAVQITLDGVYSDNATLGLYTVAGVSYLRWSEATLSGVAETWRNDIILKGGIGERKESGSLELGGNVADYQGLTVAVADADALMMALKGLGINLTGLPVTITEFIGTVADSDATSRTVIFTGIVEDQTWNDTTLNIPLKNSRAKRNKSLTTVTDEDITIPVSFGKLYPPDSAVINNLAKFVRELDTQDESIYTNEYFTGSNPEIKIFPIISIPNNTNYAVASNGDVTFSVFDPEDTYVIVFDGDGDAKGQIRQVTEFIPVTGTGAEFTFVIKDVFLTELSAANDATRSWVQFVKIERNYTADSQPCNNFLKSADGTAATQPELFSFANDKFNRIADFGLSVKDTDNNTLEIDGQQYGNDIDNLESVLILPATSLALEDSTNLSQWSGLTGSYVRILDGIYGQGIDGDPGCWDTTSLADSDFAYDKDSTTAADFSPNFVPGTTYPGSRYALVLKFGLPTIPSGLNIESIGIGIKAKLNITIPTPPAVKEGRIIVGARRFIYTKANDYKTFDRDDTTADDPNVDDLPDFYYGNLPSTSNLNYYRATAAAGGKWDTVFGYTNFILTDCDYKIFATFKEGCIILEELDANHSSFNNVMKIYDIAIIVKLSAQDIKKEIFSPLAGRIFNDTWGSRKTAANLIELPYDIIEHCKRQQDWSENAGTALIKTGVAEGSFDSTNLSYLTDQSCAFQITDEQKATTDSLVKKLCDTFGLGSYIDTAGYECIETLEKIFPAEAITLADVIGDIGDVIEPKIQNIFCEPVVNYQYNQGSEKFDKSLRVTNITEAAWQSSYTPGYTDADGESVWNACKVLYSSYRNIEPCTSEFSDQYLIPTYAVAVKYAQRKIEWMNKLRLSFTIKYSKGCDYHVFKHVMVQLPHHTDNISVECIIEEITKNKNDATVSLSVVVLDALEIGYYDTNYSTNEYVDTPDTGDEIVDI